MQRQKLLWCVGKGMLFGLLWTDVGWRGEMGAERCMVIRWDGNKLIGVCSYSTI